MDIKKILKEDLNPFHKKEKKKPETISEHLWSWVKTIIGAIIVVMFINGALIASFMVPTQSMESTVLAGDFLFVNKFVYGPTTPQIVPFLNIPIPFIKFPGYKDPEVGDVIVFIYPGDRDSIKSSEFIYYLKRCVATAGDTLEIRNKNLYVNGKKYGLPEHGQYTQPEITDINAINFENSVTFPQGAGYTKDNYGPIRIPKKGDLINLNPDNIVQWNMFIQREGHQVEVIGSEIMIDGKTTSTYKVERDYCFGMGDNRDNSSDSRYWGFVPYDNVVGTPMVVYWSWDPNMPMMNNLIEKFKSLRLSRLGKIIT